MKSKQNFAGAVGAWITSEMHPTGASFDTPNSDFSSVRFNGLYSNLDYMSIGWFGVDMSNPQQPTLQTSNTNLAQQVAEARAQNPGIILFALLAYTDTITKELKKIINSPALLQAFASNIATYLGDNGLNGFDIDWETPTTDLSQPECAAWINAMGIAFSNTYYLAISPSSTTNLDPTAVNNHVDLINLQSFWVDDPSDFIQYGINANLLGFGAYFESNVTATQAYESYVAGIQYNGTTYPYNSMISWRLDSGNWPFEQSQQMLMGQLIKGGPYEVPFNDGAIIQAQTTPTLMQSISIRTGDVVDAIQVTNQNPGGSYVVQLLQHGGNGGKQNPVINLTGGLNSFSYVTGYWYGQQVIAQLTINGKSYPAAINSAVSDTQSQQVTAPAGKTIIAFSGTTQYVNLAGGGFTWVIADIQAVFG